MTWLPGCPGNSRETGFSLNSTFPDGQVEHHLLDLSRVRDDRSVSRHTVHVEDDVLTQQTLEHLLEIRDDLAEVEDLRLQHLFAAECEKLSRKHGGALRGFADFQDLPVEGIFRQEALQRQVAVAEHRCQQIVEIVRHTPCKPADRFHLLRLVQLGLEFYLGVLALLAPRNVARDRKHARDFLAVDTERNQHSVEPYFAAGKSYFVLQEKGASDPGYGLDIPQQLGARLGREEAAEILLNDLFRG
jgi:hypothetical protein